MDRAQRKVIIFRDVTCILVGATGLLGQAFLAKEASPILVPAFLGLLLGPTGFALWAQRSSVGQGTTDSFSGEQPPSSSQSLSSSP